MKYLFLTLFICSTFYAKAQLPNTDTSVKRVAPLVCDCLTKNKVSQLDAKAGQEVFVKCLLDSAGEQFAKIFSGDEGIEDDGKKFGENMAMELLAVGCTEFLNFSMNAARENKSDLGRGLENTNRKLTGIVTRTEVKDLLTLFVKDASGREYGVLVMGYFEGSEKFLLNPASYKGKKVEVIFNEVEIYNPRVKDFVKRKELTSITVLKK